MGWGAVLAALDDYRELTRVMNGAWPPLIVPLQNVTFAGEADFRVNRRSDHRLCLAWSPMPRRRRQRRGRYYGAFISTDGGGLTKR